MEIYTTILQDILNKYIVIHYKLLFTKSVIDLSTLLKLDNGTMISDFVFATKPLSIFHKPMNVRPHYENTPMQYTEIIKVEKKMKIFSRFFFIFFLFLLKHRLWLHIRTAPPRRF